MKSQALLLSTLLTLGGVSLAGAGTVTVSSNIDVSETWTADNVYNLDGTIYVLPGATLTIEAGTVVATDNGSLAVTNGAKIFVNGSCNDPVIMTSVEDVATWRTLEVILGGELLQARGALNPHT